MTPLPIPDLDYARFFPDGNLLDVAREGNPYAFLGTYLLIRRALGYRAHYVNYGYWPDGLTTTEPGRRLALLAGEALGLQPGDRLLEVGSGLGQAAADLCRQHDLAAVVGINPSTRQVAFANALAEAAGVADRVSHREGDACEVPVEGFSHVLALECISHFPDPDRFLRRVREGLRPGGRLALTIAVRHPARSRSQRLVERLMDASHRSGAHWRARLEASGLQIVQHTDLTRLVLGPVTARCREQLTADPKLMHPTEGIVSRIGLRWLLQAGERGVRDGTIGYELFIAEVPSA